MVTSPLTGSRAVEDRVDRRTGVPPALGSAIDPDACGRRLLSGHSWTVRDGSGARTAATDRDRSRKTEVDVELIEAIKKTGATRQFKRDPVPDEVLERVFDAARFGPQGGNRQPVRYVVVRDPQLKRQLGEWYRDIWSNVVDMAGRGRYRVGRGAGRMLGAGTHLAEHFGEVPVIVVVCAVFADLARTDAALDRPGIVGGASVYPSVQNLLLAARNEGLGAVLTTLLCAVEPRLKELLAIPDELVTCAAVPLGYPARPLPNKLTREPVRTMVFADRYGEPLFS
jgi:nitroreductase